MDEVLLNRKFQDLSSETPEKECLCPGCHNPRTRTLYCCSTCRDRWESERPPIGANFRLWVVEQVISAEDIYVRLRQEDP